MKPNDTLLEALLELQVLDRVPRSGWMLRGVPDPESVSEHNWHVVFLVWALGPKVPGLDLLRCLEIAMIHDLAEARLGDLPRTAGHYLSRAARHQAEGRALEEILAPLGDRASPLYAEYRDGKTAEARFVAACDKLQLMLKVTLYEHWGAAGLSEFWSNPANFPEPGFLPVDRLIEELRARRSAG